MGYLRGKIRTENITTAAIIFSAYYRSLMIYFLTPLFAAGAITGKEIEKIEAHTKRSQYGLKGDIKSESIQKVLAFHAEPTSKLISKIGFRLRSKINTASRARPKKGFEEETSLSFD